MSLTVFATSPDTLDDEQVILNETDESYIGKNAMSSLENWQNEMFVKMGLAATIGSGNHKYFAEGTAAPEAVSFQAEEKSF